MIVNKREKCGVQMHIVVIGVNHRTAPVELRERLAFPEHVLPEALARFRETRGVLEGIILSTCNRTELIFVADHVSRAVEHTERFLESWSGVPQAEFRPVLYVHRDEKAITHLFRVACGLDSMIVGETEILGQVKDAFFLARDLGNTGSLLNRLLQQVITFAKRMHTETGINDHPVSTSYAAIELMKQVYGELKGKRVVIIGAGNVAQLMSQYLQAAQVGQITIVNRTLEKAQALARAVGGQAVPLDALNDVLADSDIVVSATGAPGVILTIDQVKPLVRSRSRRRLFMDMAVPRDLDPQIHQLPNTFLYDIDDLEGYVQAQMAERLKEARRIEGLIAEEVDAFRNWMHTLGVIPLIAALREKGQAIHRETMESLQNKLPQLSERELKIIRKHMMSVVNQLIRDPIQRIKELASEPQAEQAQNLFATIFALEEYLLEQELKQQETMQQRSHATEEARNEVPAPLPFRL